MISVTATTEASASGIKIHPAEVMTESSDALRTCDTASPAGACRIGRLGKSRAGGGKEEDANRKESFHGLGVGRPDHVTGSRRVGKNGGQRSLAPIRYVPIRASMIGPIHRRHEKRFLAPTHATRGSSTAGINGGSTSIRGLRAPYP